MTNDYNNIGRIVADNIEYKDVVNGLVKYQKEYRTNECDVKGGALLDTIIAYSALALYDNESSEFQYAMNAVFKIY